MTTQDFRCLSRGDLVEVDGNGLGVVEACFLKLIDEESLAFVDLRLKSGELVPALPETEAALFHPVLEAKFAEAS